MSGRSSMTARAVVLGGLLAAAAPASGGPLFTSPYSSTDIEHGCERVAVADFNEDGIPDIAALSYSTDVHIMDGLGDGTFAAPRRFNGDGYPDNFTLINNVHSLAVTDLNGDGHADVVNANYRTVHALLGDGRGGMGRPLTFEMGYNVNDVQVDDLNGDGIPDLLALNVGFNTISVRLGRGDGTFLGLRTYPGTGALGFGVATDLNRDGFVDFLATRTSGDSLSLFWNDGTGAFDRVESFHETAVIRFVALAAGDLNADDRPDLVLVRFTNTYDGGEETLVRLGLGDGTFAPAVVYAGNYGDLIIEDFDGDGINDVIGGGYNILFHRGRGDGTLEAARSIEAGGNGDPPVLVDLNGDGHKDIVSGGGAGVSVALSLASGDFPRVPRLSIPERSYACSLADVDADGNLDILGVSSDDSSATLYIVPGLGARGLGEPRFEPLPEGGGELAIGDWNGDARLDVAVIYRDENRIRLYQGSGESFTPVGSLETPRYPFRPQVRDLNADGRDDLIVTSLDEAVVSVFTSEASGASAARIDYPAPQSRGVPAFGDFNGDGVTDMIIAAEISELAFSYTGRLGGTFERSGDLTLNIRARAIAAADFDGDGRADLVAAHSDSLTLFISRGSGVFDRRRAYPLSGFPFGLSLADLNGDGRPDVLVDLDGSVKGILLGQADGTLKPPEYVGVGYGGGRPGLGDMNGDGRTDLVVAERSSLALYVNIGAPPATLIGPTADADGWNVAISWSVSGAFAMTPFNVYRGVYGRETFVKLNDAPLRSTSMYEFVDDSIQLPGHYEYQVRQVDASGGEFVSGTLSLVFLPQIANARILRVRPNPFRDQVRFTYETSRPGPAFVEIFDVAGRRVRRMELGIIGDGRAETTWDGRCDSGELCAAGQYFLRLSRGGPAARVTLVR